MSCVKKSQLTYELLRQCIVIAVPEQSLVNNNFWQRS